MCDWICYFIYSPSTKNTYIGSTNNFSSRLTKHNTGRGAKYTKNKGPWIPILIISGFCDKIACLSFEAGWKKVSRKRTIHKLFYINQMIQSKLAYGSDTRWNRLMDLLYFVHNTTFIDNHFRVNYDMKHMIICPDTIIINIFIDDWIANLPWPYFIENIVIEY